jgi:hypothetical protein
MIASYWNDVLTVNQAGTTLASPALRTLRITTREAAERRAGLGERFVIVSYDWKIYVDAKGKGKVTGQWNSATPRWND